MNDKNQLINFLNTEGKHEFAKVEGASGKVFEKQIIKFGDYVDPWFPEWPMTLDYDWGIRIKQNFDAKVVGRVAVPAGHTDDPEKNRGELINMTLEDDGIIGQLDIRDPQTVADIENDLIWDDSISFTNNYVDEKGNGYGPALFHVALVNNPYITGMTGFQALSKVVSDMRFSFSKNHSGSAIILSKSIKETKNMGKIVKNTKAFDVKVNYQDEEGKDVETTIVAGAELEVPEATAVAVEQQIASATEPEKVETEDEKTARIAKETEDANIAAGKNADGTEKTTDPVVTPPATDAAELSKTERAEFEAMKAERGANLFAKLLAEGKVIPAQKESFLELSKTAGVEALAKSYETAGKVIDFSEKGSQNEHKQDDSSSQNTDLSKNVLQWSDLSQTERDDNQKLGVSEAMFNTTALANPQFYQKPATN